MVWHSRIVDRAGSPGLYPAHTRTTALDVIIDGAELSQDNGCSGREGKGRDDAVSVWKWAWPAASFSDRPALTHPEPCPELHAPSNPDL
jgi:hypothetical protein